MFHLTTGTFQTLESAFIRDLTTQKATDPLAPLLVISPSGQILNRLQRELAKSHAYLNIQFLTFFALAERVLADAPATEGRVVTDSTLYRELIQDFLEGRSETPFISKDELLRTGPIPKGLTGALASTLKDLQDSGAKVVDCANAVREGHLGEAAEGSIPILELNVLMYKALHDRGLRTSADRIRRAASVISGGEPRYERAADRLPDSTWLKNQKGIYLYGFYDLTGVQLDLVNALGAHPNARVYFPHEEGNPAYSYAEILLKDPAFTSKIGQRRSSTAALQNSGTPDGQRLEVPISEHHSPPPRNAASPERRLSGTPPHAAVAAYSCSGTHDEVWLAAKKILALTDQGVPYHEMGVLARTLEPYQNTIREVFEAHQIPFALHAEEAVGAFPLVKRARALINEARVESTDTWSGHVIWTLSMLANDIRLHKDASPTEKALWEGLFKAINSLSELDIIGRPVHWDRFLEVVNEKLESLRLPLSPTDIAGVQVMDVMTARGLSFQTVFVLGLNEKLFPRLIREDPFLSDDARSKLAQALGCRLGRKMDGFQEEKLLFHLATNSRAAALQNTGDPVSRRSEEAARGTLIDQPLTAALERSPSGTPPDGNAAPPGYLHLSCQRSDEEGKALVISLYLNDYLKKSGVKLEPLPRAWQQRVRSIPAETLTPKEVSIAFHREGEQPDVLYEKLGWNRSLLSHLLASQKEIEAFGTLGPHDGLIGQDNPQSQAILDKGISPNTLKDLAECPFKVYSRKVLELYTDIGDVEDGELTHTGRGKLIHEILEDFYKDNLKTEDLDHLIDSKSILFGDEHPELYPLVWQAEKAKITAMIKRFIPLDLADQEATGFKPTYFETLLEGQINGIKLLGRVDRLDIAAPAFAKATAGKGASSAEAAFRVIDYKSGGGGIKKGESVETAIMKGKSFQLPVYMALAKTWLEANPPSPAVAKAKAGKPAAKEGLPAEALAKEGSAVFYRLQDEDPFSDRLEIGPAFWKEHGERFYENLAFLVKNIESGSYYIRPSGSRGYCDWCDYASICRKEHKPTQTRSKDSPKLRQHEDAFKGVVRDT